MDTPLARCYNWGTFVLVDPAAELCRRRRMRAVDIIRKKRDGHPLNPEEIEAFVGAATRRQWPDYQVAALLMAIVLRGMDETETAALTGAMVRSGVRLD